MQFLYIYLYKIKLFCNIVSKLWFINRLNVLNIYLYSYFLKKEYNKLNWFE